MITVPNVLPLTPYQLQSEHKSYIGYTKNGEQQGKAQVLLAQFGEMLNLGAQDHIGAMNMHDLIEQLKACDGVEPKFWRQTMQWIKRSISYTVTPAQLPAVCIWNAAAQISRDSRLDFRGKVSRITLYLREAAELLVKLGRKDQLLSEFHYIYNAFSSILAEIELLDFFKLSLNQVDSANDQDGYKVLFFEDGASLPDLSSVNVSWAIEFSSFVAQFYYRINQVEPLQIYSKIALFMREKNAFYRFFARYLIAITIMRRSVNYGSILARDLTAYYQAQHVQIDPIYTAFINLIRFKEQFTHQDAPQALDAELVDHDTIRLYRQTSSFQLSPPDCRVMFRVPLAKDDENVLLFLGYTAIIPLGPGSVGVRAGRSLFCVDLTLQEVSKIIQIPQQYSGQLCVGSKSSFVEATQNHDCIQMNLQTEAMQKLKLPVNSGQKAVFLQHGGTVYIVAGGYLYAMLPDTFQITTQIAVPLVKDISALSEFELLLRGPQPLVFDTLTRQTRVYQNATDDESEDSSIESESLNSRLFRHRGQAFLLTAPKATGQPYERKGTCFLVDQSGQLWALNLNSFQKDCPEFQEETLLAVQLSDTSVLSEGFRHSQAPDTGNAPDVQQLMKSVKKARNRQQTERSSSIEMSTEQSGSQLQVVEGPNQTVEDLLKENQRLMLLLEEKDKEAQHTFEYMKAQIEELRQKLNQQ